MISTWINLYLNLLNEWNIKYYISYQLGTFAHLAFFEKVLLCYEEYIIMI